MMRSIAEHGLDPGDAFYVVPDEEQGDDLVVVDGNRRLAALKVLADPTVLKGSQLASSVERQLTSAAKGFDPKGFGNVSCVLFDDRDSANDWILRRHGRGMEGEARIAWNPLETQRFQNDWTVLDVLDFVERNSTFSADAWSAIRTAVTNNSSTLRRFLDSAPGRDWLGLEITEESGARVPGFRRDATFVRDVLSRIFSDISKNEITSRRHNTASQITAYFDALPDDLHPSGAKGALQIFREVTLRGKEPRTKPAKRPQKRKTVKTRPPRATLAPSSHPFAEPSSEKGAELLREAAKIRLIILPLAGAYVLRAFLEQTVDAYMTRHGLPFWEKEKQLDLGTRASRVIEHLIASGAASSKDLKGVRRTLTTRGDPASIQALNDYHHDRYQVPAADTLRNAWDSAEPLFIAVYGPA